MASGRICSEMGLIVPTLCYGGSMARGFDSKFVESQQDEAQRSTSPGRSLTPDERARLDRRRTLELALARTQAELQAACHAAHRDMLRLKLEALQAELGTL